MASQSSTTEAPSKRHSDTAASNDSRWRSEKPTNSAASTKQAVRTASEDGSGLVVNSPSVARTRSEDCEETSRDSRDTARSWAWNFDTDTPCTECGAQEYTRSESGEWYCEECGAIQSRGDVEQREPGWTSQEERRSGPSTGPSDIQIGSSVGTPWANEGGRWAKYNERLSYQNKRLLDSLKEIKALVSALELTGTTCDEAGVLFQKTASAGLLKGRSVEAVTAACVYIAARQNSEPLTFSWLADVSPVSESEISNTYRKLLTEFELEMNIPVPAEFVNRIGSDASLSISVRRRAHEMLREVADANEHIGQSPTGMAAAALYGAAMEENIEITQQDIADCASVSVVTLSRQWQTIKSVDTEQSS